MRRTIVPFAGLVGLLVGVISSHTLFASSWTALIFWGVVGLVIGAAAPSTRKAGLAGIAFGLVLTITFLLTGFKGAPGEFIRFVAVSVALGVLGALCGLVLAVISHSCVDSLVAQRLDRY